MSVPLVVDERPLGRRERHDAAELAVRAFRDDPFFRFVMPVEARRDQALYFTHRTVLAHTGPDARVRTVRSPDDTIIALALWLPTGRHPQSPFTQLAQLPGTVRAVVGSPESMRRGYAYVKAAASAHPTELHWYLHLLMTDPAHQRRGLGGALMHDGLARVDAEGVGASLETQKEENLTYYARFGFALRSALHPVADGPPLYSLWRPPTTP